MSLAHAQSLPAFSKPAPARLSGISADFFARLTWVVALAVGALGVCRIWISLAGAPGEETHDDFMLGFALLGCAVALAQTQGTWFEKGQRALAALGRAQFAIATGLVGIALSWLILRCGMRQFGGYDHSGIIEAGWRLVQGQRPYIDFPCTVPLAFFLGVGYAFKLFGVSWHALILFTALFSAATFFWSVWLALRLFGRRDFALFFGLTVQSLSLLLFSYWWYNPITSASAVIFLLSAALLWHRPDEAGARWSYAGALTLLAMMKPNIAGVLIICVSLVFLCSAQRRVLGLLLSASSFAAFVLILWANHLSLVAMLKSYLAVRDYGASTDDVTVLFKRMPVWVRWSSFLAAGGVLLPALVSSVRARSLFFNRCPWIGIAGILAGASAFLVNGECKLVDIVPALAGSILVAAELQRPTGATERSRNQSGARTFLSAATSGWATSRPQEIAQPAQTSQLTQLTELTPSTLSPRATEPGSGSHSVGSSAVKKESLCSLTERSSHAVGPPLALSETMRPLIIGLCLMLGIAAAGMAITRDRVRSIGKDRFFEYQLEPAPVQSGFFKGVYTGPTFRVVLAQVEDVLKQNPNARVFFGPRMQWAYAAFKRPSPPGQPIIWAPGAFFPRAEMPDRVASFFQAHYDLMVLRKEDLIYYPIEMLKGLVNTYRCDQSYSRLTIGRLNLPTDPPLEIAAGTAGFGGWLDCMGTVLFPEERFWYLTEAFLDRGETAQALPNLIGALRRQYPEVLDNLNWILLGRLPAEIHHRAAPARLVELAERACAFTHYQQPRVMGILAAACAQVGRFDDAASLAARARKLALNQGDKECAGRNEQRLRLFKEKQPFEAAR